MSKDLKHWAVKPSGCMGISPAEYLPAAFTYKTNIAGSSVCGVGGAFHMMANVEYINDSAVSDVKRW